MSEGNAVATIGPVAAVAEQLGVPARTLYNWIRAKKLATRKENGRAVVSVEEARALLASRAAAQTPASAGNAAGSGRQAANGKAPTSSLTGGVAAKGFKALQDGVDPVDLVSQLGMPPDDATALVEHFEKLTQIGSKPGSKMSERFAAVEQRLEFLAEDTRAATDNFMLAQTVAALKEELHRLNAVQEQIIAWTHSVPAPLRNLRCSCGAVGCTGIAMQCSACGAPSVWGAHPQRR